MKLKKEKKPYTSSGKPTDKPIVPKDVVARLNPSSFVTVRLQSERGSLGTTAEDTRSGLTPLAPAVAS